MKKADAIPSNANSASKVQASGASKLSARYWAGRVFQNRGAGFYFVQVQHGGTRRAVCLQTTDNREASIRAAKIYEAIRLRGWDAALAEANPNRVPTKDVPTIGDVCAGLATLDKRPATVRNYSVALRWWGAQILGLKPSREHFGPRSAEYRARLDAVQLSRLDGKTCTTIAGRFIAESGSDATLQRRAKLSIRSLHRNAKAGLRAVEKAERLTLPEPKPFAGFQPPAAKALPYRGAINAPDLLRRAHAELAGRDLEAFRVVLLGLGAGLRRSEIANLRWRHVDGAKSRIVVESHGTFQTKNDASESAVHVDAGLINALGKAGEPSELVVSALAVDAAVQWLRAQGVTALRPLHELRKEFGSLVFQSSDLLTASRQLRHGSLAMTAQVYVEARTKAAPAIGAMLAGGAA